VVKALDMAVVCGSVRCSEEMEDSLLIAPSLNVGRGELTVVSDKGLKAKGSLHFKCGKPNFKKGSGIHFGTKWKSSHKTRIVINDVY
jgi:hypothetical protein